MRPEFKNKLQMYPIKTIGLALGLALAFIASVFAQGDGTSEIANKFVYVEFQASDLTKTKTFFERVFGWNFAEQSPEYMTFFDGRLAGGFIKSEKSSTQATGGALVSIYSANLEETRTKIMENGGKITQDIVGATGGRRFVFQEPSGNELAVVSSK